MQALLHDLRDTWRGLRRDRLYAAAVIGTLALTLGASTAVFSIVNGVLLRPLNYSEPDQLVSIREILPDMVQQYPTLPVTPRHFDVWRSHATSFSSMAMMDWRTATLTGQGDAAQVVVLRTSGTLFDVLRVPVAMGRGLTLDDERQDHPKVAVISDELWRQRLGGNPSVLGKTIALGGTDYTVVGVLPRACGLPSLKSMGETGTIETDVSAIVPFRINLADYDWMGEFNYGVVARLKPGVTLERARTEMNVLQGTVAELAKKETHENEALRGWVMPLDESIVGSARRGLLLLLGAIAGVLLIACANLANLTLTRTMGRMRDAAVRGALGASRWRLVRAAVIDQLVLAAVGGLLGIGVAAAALRAFVTTAPVTLPRVGDVVIDARVLVFVGVVALLAAAMVALLPAWRLGRGNLESILRSGGRTSDRGGRQVRSTLLTAQVALSVMLLAVSGLFISSLRQLLRVDTGFAPGGALTVEMAPVSAQYPDTPKRAALYDRILERVRAIPTVTAAAWTSALPLTGETWVDKIVRADRAQEKNGSASANYRFVGPDYFKAVGMPLMQGRSIEESDRGHTVVPAVISSNAARSLWPDGSALGREFMRGNPQEHFQVVGIVADGHVTSLEADPPLMVYVPYWYNNEGKSVLVVRARDDASALVPMIRAAVREVDPDVAVAHVAPLSGVVDAAVSGRRYQASLFTAFGLVALLIAVVGVYATTAYGISRRRREMNIRVALGARTSQVFSLVLTQSVTPIAVGLGAGLVGALAIGGIVASLLYDVRARDPLVLTAVVVIVAAVGALSAAGATLGGLDLEPAAALRDE